jgi:hypothetical protein
MRVAAGIDDVWRALLAHPSRRGTLAGYTGTAVLEEADDDARVARFRLQGARDGLPATARVTAALTAAGDGTEIGLAADVHGEIAPDALVAAVEEAAREAPPAVTAADEAAPAAPPVGAAPPEAAPPPAPSHGLPAPAKGALVAAGAALALWALRGRR